MNYWASKFPHIKENLFAINSSFLLQRNLWKLKRSCENCGLHKMKVYLMSLESCQKSRMLKSKYWHLPGSSCEQMDKLKQHVVYVMESSDPMSTGPTYESTMRWPEPQVYEYDYEYPRTNFKETQAIMKSFFFQSVNQIAWFIGIFCLRWPQTVWPESDAAVHRRC